MNIVLQHSTTGEFLQQLGVWTSNLEQAMDFGTSARAIKFLRQHHLSDVQVLVAFVERPFLNSVALQLPESARPAA